MGKTPLELAEGIGKKECCGNCFYWDKFPSDVKEAYVGKCRRYPPPGSGIVEDRTCIGPKFYFPVTVVGEWCGEHKILENKEENKKEEFKKNLARK